MVDGRGSCRGCGGGSSQIYPQLIVWMCITKGSLMRLGFPGQRPSLGGLLICRVAGFSLGRKEEENMRVFFTSVCVCFQVSSQNIPVNKGRSLHILFIERLVVAWGETRKQKNDIVRGWKREEVGLSGWLAFKGLQLQFGFLSLIFFFFIEERREGVVLKTSVHWGHIVSTAAAKCKKTPGGRKEVGLLGLEGVMIQTVSVCPGLFFLSALWDMLTWRVKHNSSRLNLKKLLNPLAVGQNTLERFTFPSVSLWGQRSSSLPSLCLSLFYVSTSNHLWAHCPLTASSCCRQRRFHVLMSLGIYAEKAVFLSLWIMARERYQMKDCFYIFNYS